MGRLGLYVLSLWLLGAALYSVNTLLFFNAVDVFSGGDKTPALTSRNIPSGAAASSPTAEAARPAVSTGTAARDVTPRIDVQPGVAGLDAGLPPAGAIGPATGPSANAGEAAGARGDVEQQPPLETAEAVAEKDRRTGEWMQVVSGVNMRAGPSTANPVITVQRRGTALEVLARDGAWIEVRNPDTGETGWVYASYLGPAEGPVQAAGSASSSAPPTGAEPPSRRQPLDAAEPPATAQNSARLRMRESPPESERLARLDRESPPAEREPIAGEEPEPPVASRPFPLLPFFFGGGPQPPADADRPDGPAPEVAEPARRSWNRETFWSRFTGD